MVLLTGLGVASVAYINAQATVSQLILEVFDSKVSATRQRAEDYAATAHATLVSTRRLVETGALPNEPEALVDYLVEILVSTERISILTIGTNTGDASWVARDLDGSIRIYQYIGVSTDDPRHRVYRLEDDGQRVLEVDEPTTYDARVRPWFKKGLTARETPRWTEPYLFVPENKPGISLTQRLELDGKEAGVMTVDFRLDFLSRGLRELDQGYGTEGVIFDSAGFVVGHSEEGMLAGADGDIATLIGHKDPALRAVAGLDLAAVTERVVFQTNVDDETYAVAVHPPPAASADTLPWWTAVIIPQQALLRDVREQALWGVLVAFAFLALAGLTSIALSRRITHSFYGFYAEMERVGRLELKPWKREPTRIAEIERLGEQLESLKAGLESFSRYVPIDLVRTLLADGQQAEVGGETREVSVFFSDIANFTTTVERTPPAAFLPALSAYLNEATTAISDAKGNVVSFMGDGLMAVFGAPVARDCHAADACRAALEARDRSRAMVLRAEQENAPVFPTRYGINTGPALVGNIGATERFDYSAIGDTTNTAARLEGLNKQYGTEILVGPNTRGQASDDFVFRRIDRVRMKGKRVPLVVYELFGARATVSDEELGAIATYEAALESYWARDFEAARSQFEACAEALDGDAPSATMVAMCARFLAEPPPEDWDGTRDVLVK